VTPFTGGSAVKPRPPSIDRQIAGRDCQQCRPKLHWEKQAKAFGCHGPDDALTRNPI
jgi:hypothetical protein